MPLWFLALFWSVGLGIGAFGLVSWRQAAEAAHWPTVTGTITSSDFRVNTDDDGTTYRTIVEYEYEVRGAILKGDKIAFGYAGSSSEKFHQDLYQALKPGVSLAVRYDPDKPTRAVLAYGINQSIIFLLVFAAIWTGFMAGISLIISLSERGAASLLEKITIY